MSYSFSCRLWIEQEQNYEFHFVSLPSLIILAVSCFKHVTQNFASTNAFFPENFQCNVLVLFTILYTLIFRLKAPKSSPSNGTMSQDRIRTSSLTPKASGSDDLETTNGDSRPAVNPVGVVKFVSGI